MINEEKMELEDSLKEYLMSAKSKQDKMKSLLELKGRVLNSKTIPTFSGMEGCPQCAAAKNEDPNVIMCERCFKCLADYEASKANLNSEVTKDQLDRMEAAIQVNHQLLLHILRKSDELLAKGDIVVYREKIKTSLRDES